MMRISRSKLQQIIKEEIEGANETSGTEFEDLLRDRDIPLGDKEWIRMLASVAGERMAVVVYKKKQAEYAETLSAHAEEFPERDEPIVSDL